jgi:hypothetical protein
MIQTRVKTNRRDRKPTRDTSAIIFMLWEICKCIVALTPYKSVVRCLTCLNPTEPFSLSFRSGVRDSSSSVDWARPYLSHTIKYN